MFGQAVLVGDEFFFLVYPLSLSLLESNFAKLSALFPIRWRFIDVF
jgi:hypothetical protein